MWTHTNTQLSGRENRRGFTIVELLIVIVVIGILAAITIVAYNGVQDRAKTTNAQTTSTGLIKKIELYSVDKGTYPTTLAQMTGAGAASQPYYVTNITFIPPFPVATSTPNTLTYVTCESGTGYQIFYWNYQTKALGFYTGGAQTNCAAAP